ncbi:hypothetical protein RFI_27436 [Reticulomyxa filosa]|uniref:Uncharacterized protein n=1 Tax=Reticulomyxa filosa TaxID=46433 RepID=X6M7Q7_RETFI|nr:hypothetical protein RFI_27436 [Reticulomyxa filosa]|eukprot:ETO09939.1 hypothetical protein RFI_27436 [Reticulomyxa filosa]
MLTENKDVQILWIEEQRSIEMSTQERTKSTWMCIVQEESSKEKLGIKLTMKKGEFLKKKESQSIPIKHNVQHQLKQYSYADAVNNGMKTKENDINPQRKRKGKSKKNKKNNNNNKVQDRNQFKGHKKNKKMMMKSHH